MYLAALRAYPNKISVVDHFVYELSGTFVIYMYGHILVECGLPPYSHLSRKKLDKCVPFIFGLGLIPAPPSQVEI